MSDRLAGRLRPAGFPREQVSAPLPRACPPASFPEKPGFRAGAPLTAGNCPKRDGHPCALGSTLCLRVGSASPRRARARAVRKVQPGLSPSERRGPRGCLGPARPPRRPGGQQSMREDTGRQPSRGPRGRGALGGACPALPPLSEVPEGWGLWRTSRGTVLLAGPSPEYA